MADKQYSGASRVVSCMVAMTKRQPLASEQDRSITEAVRAQRGQLQRLVRRYVVDPQEVEDILQDVFYELVDAYRLMKPIEQIGAWLYRVARNRVTDRFRKHKPLPLLDEDWQNPDEDSLRWDELLPSPEAGPEAALARAAMLREIEAAIAALPAAQREVFIAHELEGRSFKELAAEKNISINTLLARKHAAVNALRARLQSIYDEFGEE